MGMQTTLYGYIAELDAWRGPVRQQVFKHNASVIRSLPIADPWPPLSKEMFAITTNYKNTEGPWLAYRSRIIHFGASLKTVEQEWVEWKFKFEQLLSRLYFYEARVHILAEYLEPATACWTVDLLKYEIKHDGCMPELIVPAQIDYERSLLDDVFGDGK